MQDEEVEIGKKMNAQIDLESFKYNIASANMKVINHMSYKLPEVPFKMVGNI